VISDYIYTFLITGGAGFIGSEFVRYKLKNSNDKIIVLDILTYAGNLDNLKDYLNENNIILPLKQETILNVKRIFEDKETKVKIENLNEDFERIKLKTEGYKVNFVKLSDLKDVIQDLLQKERLIFVIGNIMDREVTDILFSLSDIVVHYAAETHVDRSIINADAFIKTDVYGTYVLLESLRKNKNVWKFVHISTDEVYGSAPEGVSFKETDPINPRNPYSASKAAADRLCSAYYNTYKIPVIIIRPSNNFGPYQYPEKLIPLMTINALNDEPLPVYGDGRQKRDWLYVEDCARGVDLVIEKGKIGEVYNISGRNERENIEIVKMILKILNKPESLIKFVKDRPGHDKRYSVDDSKIRELGLGDREWGLGIRDLGLEEKIERTVKWYVENEWWWRKVREKDREYNEFIKKWYGKR